MKFKIHNGTYEDSLIIEGETIKECREKTNKEVIKRGWDDCWSEKVEK